MLLTDRKKQKKLKSLPFNQVKKEVQEQLMNYFGVEIDYSRYSLEKIDLEHYMLNTAFPAYAIKIVVPAKGPVGYEITEIPPEEINEL
ncbi:MAG TPA: hypothetical protein PLH65_00035 [bacterium]|nr:hypothetical protein [bacterium]